MAWGQQTEVRVRNELRRGVLTHVGALYSTFEWRDSRGSYVERGVRNIDCRPEPCGICKGTGRVIRLYYMADPECGACEARGHSPEKSQAVTNLVKTVAAIGVAAVTLLKLKALVWKRGKSIARRDVIDAEPHPLVRQCIEDHMSKGQCPNCVQPLEVCDC